MNFGREIVQSLKVFGVKTRSSIDASLTSTEEDPASGKFLLHPLSNRELLEE